MRKYWLLFAQAVTVALAVLFVLALFRPDLLHWKRGDGSPKLTIFQSNGAAPSGSTESFAGAAKRATPAVVNVFTRKESRGQRSPFAQGPVNVS